MVKYLEVNKEKLPIRISYSALKKFQEETGKSLMGGEGLKDIFTGELEVLLFYGLQSGFKIEQKVFPFKKDQMEDILDVTLFEFIKLIPEFFPKDDAPKKPETVSSLKKTKN